MIVVEPDLLRHLHFWIGCFALVSGFTAFIVRKGTRIHRASGQCFTAAMILLALSGLWLSLSRENLFTVFLSLITLHALVTGWAAAHSGNRLARWVTAGAAVSAALIAAGAIAGGILASRAPGGMLDGLAPQAFYGLALAAGLLGVFDALYRRAQTPAPQRRITRHLGRMGFAFFLATGIFFFGNSHVLPEAVRQPLLLAAPVLAVVVWTVVYAVRTRLSPGLRVWTPALFRKAKTGKTRQ